jgi:adenosylmethionine---8-amino-7-oxononanoate aminotransferase
MRICTSAKRRGVFVRPLGDTIVLMPPLSITTDEIVTLVETIAAGIREVCDHDGA